jgi:uncharacterized protein
VIARITIAVTVAFAIASPIAEAKFEPPKLEGHLVDTSGTVSPQLRSSIDGRLDAFRKRTSYAIVVFVAGSLQGESIEDAAYTAFNTWGIGDKGKDNGVLLLIAPTERKIRIETGKGAGGAITDLQASDIIAMMGPAMKAYKLDEAIGIACTELERLIMKEPGIAPAEPETKKTKGGIVRWIVFGVLGLVGLAFAVSRKFRGFASSLASSSSSSTESKEPTRSYSTSTSSDSTESSSSSSGSDDPPTYSGGGPSNYTGGGGTSGGGGASGGY